MKLNKKNVLIILLVILFLMLTGIKYYVEKGNVKNDSNPNEIDHSTNEKEESNINISDAQENIDDKNTSAVESDHQQIEEEKQKEEKKADKGEQTITDVKNDASSVMETEKNPEKTNDKKDSSNSNIKKDDTVASKNNSISSSETNQKNNNTNNNVTQNPNTTVKKEESVENPKEENSASSLSVANDSLRKNIKSKYGVTIGYKDELDGNYVNAYANPTKQYDDEKINKALNSIDVALKKYPSDFFFEISKKWKPLTIYLVERINGSAAGLTDNRNPNTVIILINTEGLLFESTLHHEIMHYIDCYLANIIGASALENSMKDYNPSGFVYGSQTNEYVYYYSNPAYFLSAYSKSNYKEDRAVLFADMMFRSLKKDYYSAGNPINEKAKLISRQLETYFDCVSSSVKENWERFIEW